MVGGNDVSRASIGASHHTEAPWQQDRGSLPSDACMFAVMLTQDGMDRGDNGCVRFKHINGTFYLSIIQPCFPHSLPCHPNAGGHEGPEGAHKDGVPNLRATC